MKVDAQTRRPMPSIPSPTASLAELSEAHTALQGAVIEVEEAIARRMMTAAGGALNVGR